MNRNILIGKIIQNFQTNGWYDIYKTFLTSIDFLMLIKTLETNVLNNKRFTPILKNVFRPFDLCRPSELKVVFLSNEPSPFLNISDGLPFSGSNEKPTPEITRYVLEAVNSNVFANEVKSTLPDLERWAKQGILMLNLSLTTELNKPGRHFAIWRPFIAFTIDMLCHKQQDIIWVCFGKRSLEMAELIPEHHTVLSVSHPGRSASLKTKSWNCENIFQEINDRLIMLGKTPIEW